MVERLVEDELEQHEAVADEPAEDEKAAGQVGTRFERPVLPIQDFTVAIHVAAAAKKAVAPAKDEVAAVKKDADTDTPRDTGREEPRDSLRSYERDMLSYAYRNNPPFNTVTTPWPDNVSLEIEFPQETSYQSEHKTWISKCPDDMPKPPRRAVRLRAAVTGFPDASLFILHLVFYPVVELIKSDTPSEYRLDEYDLVKLIKLWEGGEDQPDPGSEDEERKTVLGTIPRFFIGNVGPLSLGGLIDKVFDGKFEQCVHQVKSADIVSTSAPPTSPSGTTGGQTPHVGTRVGTVEVTLSPDNAVNSGDAPRDADPSPAEDAEEGDDEQAHWFFAVLDAIKDDHRSAFEKQWRSPDPKDNRWRRLVAVGGVIQGLLDFDRIDSSELADVFEGFAEDDRCVYEKGLSVTGFHKGTLLKISAGTDNQSDPDDRPSPVRVSPYLLVPQAVLLYNDELLRKSGKCSDDLAYIRGKNWRDRVRDSDLRINKTQELVKDQRNLLSQLSHNVFNYVSERTLFKAGQEIRGFDDRTVEMHQRLSEDAQQMEARLRRRDAYGTVSAIVFAVTGAFIGIVGRLNLGSAAGDVITAVSVVGILALTCVLLAIRWLS